MPNASLNPKTHKRLKIRSAETEIPLGKLIDKYLSIGLSLEVENLTDEEIEKIVEILKRGKEYSPSTYTTHTFP
jgi:hypothetical protein